MCVCVRACEKSAQSNDRVTTAYYLYLSKIGQRLIITRVVISYSYTMVCPPVRGDNPRALASGLSPIQADTPWFNYFKLPSSV